MFVIAGLGNPGLSYRKTRHNIGFMALDVIAERIGVKIKDKKFSGLLGEGELAGEQVILVKPQTYMNLSGDCLQQVMHFYKLPPERLLVFALREPSHPGKGLRGHPQRPQEHHRLPQFRELPPDPHRRGPGRELAA